MCVCVCVCVCVCSLLHTQPVHWQQGVLQGLAGEDRLVIQVVGHLSGGRRESEGERGRGRKGGGEGRCETLC